MNILEEAQKVVLERRDNYGGPEENFKNIAGKWSITLGKPITQTEVALMMIDLKTCRLMHSFHRDNWVDIAGYAECGNLVSESHVPKKVCQHLTSNARTLDDPGICDSCGEEVIWFKVLTPSTKVCQHPPEKVNTTGPRVYCHHCQRYILQDPKDIECQHMTEHIIHCMNGEVYCKNCGGTFILDSDTGKILKVIKDKKSKKVPDTGEACQHVEMETRDWQVFCTKCQQPLTQSPGGKWILDDGSIKTCKHVKIDTVNGLSFCVECQQPMTKLPSGNWILGHTCPHSKIDTANGLQLCAECQQPMVQMPSGRWIPR